MFNSSQQGYSKNFMLSKDNVETLFSGEGYFILVCCISIFKTLIRYSVQPSGKVPNHIKKNFIYLQ